MEYSGRLEYAPSWIDRVLEWLESLPLLIWAAYPLLFALNVLLNHSPVWLEGVVPFGRLEPSLVFSSLWFVMQGGLIHYLDHIAGSAVRSFRVALDGDEESITHVSARIRTMPAGPVWALSLLVVAAVGAVAAFSPGSLYPQVSSLPGKILGALAFMVGFLFAPTFFYHTVRQLRIVSNLYSRIQVINLFSLDPLYAWSGLTARTGAGWVLVLSLNIYQNLILRAFGLGSAFALAGLTLSSVFALLAFLLPLWGIHVRLGQEKGALLQENGARLQRSLRDLHTRTDSGDFTDFDAFQKSIDALMQFDYKIRRIPTWPWQPSTIRGFASALILPLIIFVIERIISRIIN